MWPETNASFVGLRVRLPNTMKILWTSTFSLRVRFPRKQAPVPFWGDAPVFPLFCVFGCLISLWFAPRRRGWLGGAANSYLWLNIDLTCSALSCLVFKKAKCYFEQIFPGVFAEKEFVTLVNIMTFILQKKKMVAIFTRRLLQTCIPLVSYCLIGNSHVADFCFFVDVVLT